MPMDKETLVLAFTGCEHVDVFDLPDFNPKYMTFECVDPRKCKAMRKFSNAMGVNEGELFPYKTPGGLNDLLYGPESVKNKCLDFIKLGYGFGAREVWLVSHTCCGADKEKFGEMTSEQDIKKQEEKLLNGTQRILEISKTYDMGLRVLPVFFQIIGSKGHIHKLQHSYVSVDDPARKKSVLMETAMSVAVSA